MRPTLMAGAVALVILTAPLVLAGSPRPVSVWMDADRFEISAEGNSVTGLRRAPVAYASLTALSAAIRQPQPLAAVVRLVRAAPPQVFDYVWCVTEDGALVVGQQVRSFDAASGQYVFTEGDIRRAYPALEASVPWTWIVDIPLGREVGLTLEVRAMSQAWPVRAVSVSPSVTP